MASVLELILRSRKEGDAAKKTAEELKGVKKASDGLSPSLAKLSSKLAMVAGPVAMGALILSSVKLAARVETLGIVVETLGSNADYSKLQLREFEESIKSQGITTQNTLQSMAQMIQANIDLAEGADLARIAQNNAVIANINSSEAFKRLVTILQTGNVLMGRRMGLELAFGKAQRELAKDLGKTVAQLTRQEIMQSRLNEVRRAGVAIEGTYEAAMETSGKMMFTMARLTEELQLLIGEQLLPEFSEFVEWLYLLTKDTLEFNRALDFLEESSGYAVESFMFFERIVDSTGKTVANTADEIIELYRGLKPAADAIIEHSLAMEGYRYTALEAAEAAGEVASEIGAIATAMKDVTLAEMAAKLLKELDGMAEAGGVTREEYDTAFREIAEGFLGMDAGAVDFRLAWRDLQGELTGDMVLDIAYAQSLAVEFGNLRDLSLEGWNIAIGWNIAPFPAVPLGGFETGGVSVEVKPMIPPGGFATWAAGIAAGFRYIEGEWVERQHGGPVSANVPYLVGERGPELFVPSQAGRIESTDNSRSMVIEQLVVQGGGQGIETQMAMEDSLLRVLEELV